MLLRYLSVPVQVRLPAEAEEPHEQLPWFGIYVVLSKGSLPCTRSDSPSSRDYETLFHHWFNCRLLDALLGALSDIQRYRPESLRDDALSVAHRLAAASGLDELPDVSSLQQARSTVRQLTHSVHEYVTAHETATDLAVADFRQRTDFRARLTDSRRFLQTLSDPLRDSLSSEPPAPLFLLLDQWDSLSSIQQRRLFSLFALDSPASWYMKVGSVRDPSGQLPHLPADELSVRRIEVDSDGAGFRDLCRSALDARLKYIRTTLATKGFPEEMVTAFANADTLLPSTSIESQFEKWRQGAAPHQARLFAAFTAPGATTEIAAYSELRAAAVQPLYSGVASMTNLASGFLRIFLELVYRVLTLAFSNASTASFHASVPLDLQDSAIRKECRELLDQKLKADAASLDFGIDDAGDIARTWIRSLLRRFGHSLEASPGEVYLHRTIITRDEGDDQDREAVNALSDLLTVCGLITPAASSELSLHQEYKVTRAFSALDNLPLVISTAGLRLTPHQFLELGGKRGFRKPQVPEQESLVPTTTFFATVFQVNSWNEAVREALRTRIFQELHLEYHDGQAYHHAAMDIGTKVRERMREMQLLVFEVTDENPNVCFEWGMALALHQPCYFLLNSAIDGAVQRQKESRVFRLQYSPYEWPATCTTVALGGAAIESLHAAVQELAHHYRMRAPGRRSPLGSTKALDFTQVPQSVYTYVETSGRLSRWREETDALIRAASCTPVRPPAVGRQTTLEKYLEAGSRGEKCLIDVSERDRLGCTLLGYLFMKDRDVLAVYDSEKPGVFTNWIAADAFKPYGSKTELLAILDTFIKE